MQRSALQVFAAPIVLGALSAVGLIAALLGDNVWDAVSWLTLGIPCVVMAWFWFAAGRTSGRDR